MILQRRLNSIQRDLGPLEDKVGKLLSETRLLLDIVFTIFFLVVGHKVGKWLWSSLLWVPRGEYQVNNIFEYFISAFLQLMRSALFLFLLTIFCSFRLFFTFEWFLSFFCFHRNQKNQSSGIKSMSSAVPGSTLRTTWVEIFKDKLVLVRGVALCCNGKDTTLYWFVKKEKHEAEKSKH